MTASEFGASELDAREMREIEGGSLLWDLAKAAARALLEGALEEIERMGRPTV